MREKSLGEWILVCASSVLLELQSPAIVLHQERSGKSLWVRKGEEKDRVPLQREKRRERGRNNVWII